MLKKLPILIVSLLISAVSMAAPTLGSSLNKVTSKYRSAKLVEMSVEKIVKSELLGKETKYLGKIFLAKGKFRWENSTPEETLLVFDGSTIWSVQTPPKELGGSVQVAKGKVDKKTKSNILISSLLGEELTKNFKVLKEGQEGGLSTFEVKALQDDLTVKTLKLSVNTKAGELKEIAYTDDIGNLTTMKFSNIQFKKKENSKLFKYQPPKGAQVSDL